MNRKWLVLAVAVLLSGSAFAAEPESGGVTPNLDKGTQVLEGAGSINVMADEVQLQLAYGRFVADGIELALVGGLYGASVPSTTSCLTGLLCRS